LAIWNRPALSPAFTAVLLVMAFVIGLLFPGGIDRMRYDRLAGELDDMKQMVMISLLKQSSPVDRLQGVNWSYQVKQPDPDAKEALYYAFENDPNTNIRLAALRALEPYADDRKVRQRIIYTFRQQPSPLVQIEIIDFIQQNESRPAALLNILAQDQSLPQAVVQHLKWSAGASQQ